MRAAVRVIFLFFSGVGMIASVFQFRGWNSPMDISEPTPLRAVQFFICLIFAGVCVGQLMAAMLQAMVPTK